VLRGEGSEIMVCSQVVYNVRMHCRYAAAAGVYRALAERRSRAGDAAVTLEQRLDALHNALLQARSVGDEQLTDGLRGSVKVMSLQLAIASQLKQRMAAAAIPAGMTREQLQGQLKELQSSSLDISDLYNTYAQPLELWGVCLDICNFAGNVPAEYVRQLWDLLLKQAWEQLGNEAGGEPDARLQGCCDKVQALGVNFYPNESRCGLVMCRMVAS
jgi:hypothetical protein